MIRKQDRYTLCIEQGYRQHELKAKVDLIEAVEKIVKNADKEAKAEGVKESNNKRIKDIKEHRKVEQEKLYQQEKQEFQNPKKKAGGTGAVVIPMSGMSNDDLLLLKNMQKKGMAKREE
ncbi:hypothetical protein MHB42_19270 [Lysinibacillus sp. FSL K6-0232]|uniref:hypothetical protein n=1 Tax=unclassified Lysinibacillus TaxID=2636778 RepID=UPI0030FCF4A1